MRSRCRVAAIVAATVALAATGPVGSEGAAHARRGPRPAIGLQDRTGREVATYSRTMYHWPFSAGPFYGSLPRGNGRVRPVLRTIVGDFDLGAGPLQLPEALTTRIDVAKNDTQYFVVQGDPTVPPGGSVAQIASVIADHGGLVAAHAPEAAVIARLTREALDALEALPGVFGIEPYHAAFKLHPTIGRAPLLDPFRATSEVYDLDVRVFPGEDPDAMANAVRDLGGQVSAVWPDTVRVELHRSKLADLAQIEGVQVVFEHLPVVPFGEETTTTIQTGRYNGGATPYHDAGIDGSGGGIDGSAQGGFAAGPQVLMVLDTGIQLDAGDLSQSRVSAGTPGPGHRKVRLYTTANAFGGQGDLLGCDASLSGAVTHGHVVAATALGNASAVDPATYGDGWHATDEAGATWKLDGVAPGAVLVFYDAQRTPAVASCADPLQNTLSPGDLYSGGATGSLGDAYQNHGARVFDLSWGTVEYVYDVNAMDVDTFLRDNGEAIVLSAAGDGGTAFDENLHISAPATAKNGVSIGASGAANDRVGAAGAEQTRWALSGTGPAPGARVAPLLMAPGAENVPELVRRSGRPRPSSFDQQTVAGNMGLRTEFVCGSSDNDQSDPVECDVRSGNEGTSYATAAAAGAALLVRDYFAQGFYPDATSADIGNAADQIANPSGPLVKAVLITSAEFLTARRFKTAWWYDDMENLTAAYRFNIEQGYGRIRLENALPLAGRRFGASGLLVHDSAGSALVGGIEGLPTTIDALIGGGVSSEGHFDVCNPTDELRIALVWFDEPGQTLINDLDLEVESPSGTRYRGNYFTDDDDRDDRLDANEDCPGIDGRSGGYDASPWSLPVCQRSDGTFSPFDRQNPTEAVMLSPDPLGTGDHSQIEVGRWTIRVSSPGFGSDPAQRFAIAIAGGVCTGSRVQLDAAEYACNGKAAVSVLEVSEIGDLAPGADEVASRTTVQVLEDDTVVDEEAGLAFTRSAPGELLFDSSAILLTSNTARDAGNGVLDVRDGDRIRVRYADTSGQRSSEARVRCTPSLGFGGIVIDQFGRDAPYLIHGGCERSARGLLESEFGFPDRYLDAGELATIEFAFASYEPSGLDGAQIDLRCVLPDADSPEDCLPPGGACPDPYRVNNPSCDQRPSGNPGDVSFMTILDTPRVAAPIAANAAVTVSFGIEMAPTIPGMPEVELLLSLRDATTGKSAPGLVISRQRLDADEQSLFYSTDFPTGGTERADLQNDEVPQDPTTDLASYDDDYRFETRIWSDLTAGGTKNAALSAPWNFDTNDGGFRSGILATTTFASIPDVIAQWGEDLNFNGVLDRSCSGDPSRACLRDSDCAGVGTCTSLEDRDPINGVLDRGWNIRGGCGWQTRPAGSCSNLPTQGCMDASDCPPGGACTGTPAGGGIWHTGRIGAATPSCIAVPDPDACQPYETISGWQGLRAWGETLVTPPIQKVNGPDHRIEIVDWAWNQAIDLGDGLAALAWELDTDTGSGTPSDLFSDSVVLNSVFGPHGAISGGQPWRTGGYGLFAPLDSLHNGSVNGTLGNNRDGRDACYFGAGQVAASVCPDCPFEPGSLAWAGPLDDDLDNDSDGSVDEYVRANGPVRNMSIRANDGPDMRYDKLEDLYGDTGDTFQAALMLWNFESTSYSSPPVSAYGVGIDDMVVQWREYTLVDDAASCTGRECATVDLQTTTRFGGNGTVTITVLDRTPEAVNDCDLDGLLDGTDDCNLNGTPDVVVRGTSSAEPEGEIVVLDRSVANPLVFRGELLFSTTFAGPGALRVESVSGGPDEITVTYLDNDDGTGVPCQNDANPALRGQVVARVSVELVTGRVLLASTSLSDNGDQDGFADTNETVEVRLGVLNPGETDLTGVTAHLMTADPKIDCLLRSAIYVGDIPAQSQVFPDEGFVLRVADVDRAAAGFSDLEEFAATFQLAFAADQFEINDKPQSFTLDLDLDAVGGGGPTTFFEGFESGTFGAFEPHNMDATLYNLQNSDGYRCQYSDPDWHQSNSYGRITDCFVSANQAQAAAFYWHVTEAPPSGFARAYSGDRSLYMGVQGSTPDFLTTPVSVLEAVRLQDPINLAADGPSPVLSYKHQVDLMDTKSVGVPKGAAPGRYVTMLQLADPSGNAVGDWIKLEPYLNVYDQTNVDNYFNCMFDPIDDGNTEDDFFDPTDPDRRLGPSSTCAPELNFTYIGETFSFFDPERLGDASDGPGLHGSVGRGTWIETRFNLDRFRGRRARLRFLNSDLKINATNTTWAQLFTTLNPGPGDDGIFIDDVQVTNTLASPATVTTDSKPNAGLPGCGSTCNVVTARFAADPDAPLPAPGQVVELDALGSEADRCLGGVLQFRFWIDGDGDGLGGGSQDTRLGGWSEAAILVQAPAATTTYAVEVRCSTDPACSGSATRTVVVDCPSSGTLTFPVVRATDPETFVWSISRSYDFAVGDLESVGTYATTASGQAAGPSASFDVSGDQPTAGQGLWYLFRNPGPLGQGDTGYCNAPGNTWGTIGRDAALP